MYRYVQRSSVSQIPVSSLVDQLQSVCLFMFEQLRQDAWRLKNLVPIWSAYLVLHIFSHCIPSLLCISPPRAEAYLKGKVRACISPVRAYTKSSTVVWWAKYFEWNSQNRGDCRKPEQSRNRLQDLQGSNCTSFSWSSHLLHLWGPSIKFYLFQFWAKNSNDRIQSPRSVQLISQNKLILVELQ